MSFYIRKSLRSGPFRFNLSKSGVGVSVGITGFRVGSSPRGNYVHMGRSGLYYRRTLPSGGRSSQPRANFQDDTSPAQSTTTELQEIDSVGVLELQDSSSGDLLVEMNNKHKKLQLWPIAGMLSVAVLLIPMFATAPAWSYAITVPIAGIVVFLVWRHDQTAKTVILFYELEEDAEHH